MLTKKASGFTFIELLVVISLMAIVAASVSAAYLNFERNQRTKEAAQIVKSAVRQAQNNATSGLTFCSFYTLGGWFVKVDKATNYLTIFYLCRPLDFVFTASSLNLPAGVTVGDILYGGSPIGGSKAFIFYRPNDYGVTFHSNSIFFTVGTDNLVNLLGPEPQSNLTIRLVFQSSTYDVVINPAGGVQ